MVFDKLLTQAILGTASDAIIASDQDGVIHFWNQGAERIFGYAASEAVGQSLDIIVPPGLSSASLGRLSSGDANRREPL